MNDDDPEEGVGRHESSSSSDSALDASALNAQAGVDRLESDPGRKPRRRGVRA